MEPAYNNFEDDIAPRDKKSHSLVSSLALPARTTQFGFTITKPISLLVLNVKDNHFHLSQSAKEHLATLEGECYIISVSGNPLVGKSSLLNLLLSFFTYYNNDVFQASQGKIPYQDIYTVGDGKKSTTEGIDMYCISTTGKNFIFLDVEGDNDPNRKDTGVWIYTNLIQAAVGVSHIHIYNYNGLPQETFFNYFDSIQKIVKQNKLHSDFETKHVFLKRNHVITTQEELFEELEEYKLYFEERLTRDSLDYSVYLLTNPPQHIIKRKAATSCITATGFLCDNCQGDIFTSILLGIFNELNEHFNKVKPFENGLHFITALEQIVHINARELPFFLDGGHISKIRSNRFRKEQLRIQAGLLEVEQFQMEKSLSKQIQKLMSDHPNLAQVELFENFDKTLTSLTIKISQMTFIMPELSKFVEEYLFDDSASILDVKEKDTLYETYVIHFDRLTKEIISALREYEQIIDAICANLLEIKEDIKVNLKEYMSAAFDAKARSAAVATNFVASGLIGFVAREAAVKVVAGVLVGGGAIGAALTVYTFIQAKKKWDEAKKKNEEALNTRKITGVNNVKEAEEEMKKVEEFVTGLIEDLQNNNKTLKDVCAEEESRNFKLVDKIKDVMDDKINGMNLKLDSRVKLIQGMKVAQNNLERFKQSL